MIKEQGLDPITIGGKICAYDVEVCRIGNFRLIARRIP